MPSLITIIFVIIIIFISVIIMIFIWIRPGDWGIHNKHNRGSPLPVETQHGKHRCCGWKVSIGKGCYDDDDDIDYHDHDDNENDDEDDDVFFCQASSLMILIQVLAVRDKLPDLRAIIQYGEEDVDHDGVLSWEDFQV